MAEQFLTLMADLDNDTQQIMDEWYDALRKAGFTGVQTPGLPFHISLATFPLDHEQQAVEKMKTVSAEFAEVPVHISHVGLFAGGKVLFGSPERNPELDALHASCESGSPQQYPWTPHVTVLIDEPARVYAALPVLMKSFTPVAARIARLHLCAFWPAREIAAFSLKGC